MTERCDCLNDCGDDPALKSGKATPCWRRRQAIAARTQLLADATLLIAFANSTEHRNIADAIRRILPKVSL